MDKVELYVLPAAAATLYQEQELSSVIELSQLLDQSSGTPSLNTSDQSTTYTRSNTFWRRTFFNQLNWFYVASFSSYFNCFMLLCTA